MLVRRVDGCCPACKGTLKITDLSECAFLLVCLGCGEEHEAEFDAFGPPLRYFIPLMDWVNAGRPAGQEPKPIT